MNCSNSNCTRGIGLVAYRRDWFSKRRYCSKHCRDASVTAAPNLQRKRKSSIIEPFVAALAAFVGFTILTMTVLAAPPARPEASHLPGCDRKICPSSLNSK